MMSLRDLSLKKYYSSDTDDILCEFYIPALQESISYHRLAGFFSSSSLAIAARGIVGLIKNDGKMHIIVSPKLNKEDIEIILESYTNPDKFIEMKMTKELGNLENEFVKNHVLALGWMISNNLLKIKVAIPYNNEGVPLTYEEIVKGGLFHQKVGILEDYEGNILSFSGSINESALGWLGNVEEFKVFSSWIEEERNYVEADMQKFRRFWLGSSPKVRAIDVYEAVKKKLIEIAPTHIEDINLTLLYEHIANVNTHSNKVTLYDQLYNHQKNALKSWFENHCKGILEMATGTGKTYTALACMERLYDIKRKLTVVITVPYSHLVDQWFDNIRKVIKVKLNIIKAYGSRNLWMNYLKKKIVVHNNSLSSLLVILTTHDTFYSSNFIELIKRVKGEILLIADEVHSLGSQQRRNGLLTTYNFRLGLSATPKRWLDDEGTNILYNYFGGAVFEYSLAEAINDGFLTPYDYYPHIISLTDDEMETYRKMSKRIAREYAKNKDRETKYLELLCILRQRIIVNAEEKYRKFNEILDYLDDLSFCLIYCSPEQIDAIQDILNSRGIINHRFTARENTKLRNRILKGFSAGDYRILVAMNCLDEGVDVPATKMAIIMASSGNPRQYIQRRGRILRKHPKKKKAVIHDIIVIPKIDPSECGIYELERRIIKKELKRYKEFAYSASNRLQALNVIYPYMRKYNVYGGD